ncbi:MAG: BofC C-terminal domain-containing protein [Collinsella intestinalis]
MAGVASFISIRKSVYLGVKDDAVAIYTGIPDSLLGLKLNWLEDETSIQLKYLPEDTQNRLREGIPQKNLKDAQDAVENYRAQIDETQTKLIEDARAIQQDLTGSTEAPGTSPQTPWQAERPRANRPPMPFHLQPRPREVPRK